MINNTQSLSSTKLEWQRMHQWNKNLISEEAIIPRINDQLIQVKKIQASGYDDMGCGPCRK